MAFAVGGVKRVVPERLRVHLRRLVKYGAVSVVSSLIGLGVLAYLVGIRGTSAGWANVISTSVAAVPSFELNRRWSWQARSGKAKPDQVIVFFIMTFLGLGLSTYVVHLAGLIATEHNLHPFHRTVAIEGASLGTWAALWLVQYLILDRVLFRPLAHALEEHAEAAADPAAEPSMMSDVITLVEPSPTLSPEATALPGTEPGSRLIR